MRGFPAEPNNIDQLIAVLSVAPEIKIKVKQTNPKSLNPT